MKKYNLSEIMHKAWKLYRKGVSSFAEALHRAWNSAKAAPVNAQRIEEAQQAAGVAEPVNTWAGWKPPNTSPIVTSAWTDTRPF